MTSIVDDFASIAANMDADAALLAACAAFLAANQVTTDWDAGAISLDEDAGEAACHAWHATLDRVTAILATTPAGIHAKLAVGLIAMRHIAGGEVYSEIAAEAVLSALDDALALPGGGAA